MEGAKGMRRPVESGEKEWRERERGASASAGRPEIAGERAHVGNAEIDAIETVRGRLGEPRGRLEKGAARPGERASREAGGWARKGMRYSGRAAVGYQCTDRRCFERGYSRRSAAFVPFCTTQAPFSAVETKVGVGVARESARRAR